jgi:hypothetical protein
MGFWIWFRGEFGACIAQRGGRKLLVSVASVGPYVAVPVELANGF